MFSKKIGENVKKKIVAVLVIIATITSSLAVMKVSGKVNITDLQTAKMGKVAEENLTNYDGEGENCFSQENVNAKRNSIYSSSYIEADIYVSTEGSDVTGNGSEDKPYASVKKAIEEATSGQSIFIEAGTYQLTNMVANAGYGQAGISDLGKSLEIFGEDNKTILVYNGSSSTYRDAHAISVKGSGTVVRNLTYVFYPKNSNTYSRGIFGWSSATVKNVFFRISGSNKATYLYDNNKQDLKVTNCTFFHDLGSVDHSYSGNCTYTNIATNVTTVETMNSDYSGTYENIVVDNFGTSETSLEDLIENSSKNSNFIENEAGVFYGENAWSIYGYKPYIAKKTIDKNEGIQIEIEKITGEEPNTTASDWNWSSSDTEIATVSNTGYVTGLDDGYVIITATNKSDSNMVLKVRILVGYPADIYVSKNGNDETGDGSKKKPYATVSKAINIASTGQKICILEGTYNLSSMDYSGIYDQNKQLEIFGENEKTVLVYDCTDITGLGNAVMLSNSGSVMRNLTYVFKPGTGSNYNRAMFKNNYGTIKNVFFRISGDEEASYIYGGNGNVNNCTFFHDLGSVDSNYSGSCTFTNIATNVATEGTNNNVITDNFSRSDLNLERIIVKSFQNASFIENEVGVFYGENAWEGLYGYILAAPKLSIKKNEKLQMEILKKSGTEPNTTVNDWNWSTSDAEIATVNNTGYVTGLVDGYVNIIATKKSDSSIVLELEIAVGNPADIYVSEKGNDETGDGSRGNPYATVNKALVTASAGNKICILQGTYELSPIISEAGYTCVGIYDYGKKLEIYGENEKTVLIYDGSKGTLRDGNAIQLLNNRTVLRNLTYVFTPKEGASYQKAIFTKCNGKVENVFFRISGDNKASYIYYNGGGDLHVKNCTFFHDLESIDHSYSGKCIYTDVATNVTAVETKTSDYEGTYENVVTEYYGIEDDELEELILNSECEEAFEENEVGVFYGEYAWEINYKIKNLGRKLVVSDTYDLEIEDLKGIELNPDESEWEWSSSDESVATVDSNGKVTTVGLGRVVITAVNEAIDSKLIKTIYVNEKFGEVYANAVIYIDQNAGSDSMGDGSKENPYMTLDKIADTGIIRRNYSYAIILSDGEYTVTNKIFEFNRHKSIHIFGNMEDTVLKVGSLYANSSGGSTNYDVNFYRLVWNGTTATTNTICARNDMRFYNVAFKMNFTNGSSGYFVPQSEGKYEFYNCVLPTNITYMNRADIGEMELTNCYGGFTSGANTVDSDWNYQTNYITDVPKVNDKNYQITDDGSVWKNVGTGKDNDGTAADLGVYGGVYSWEYELSGTKVKKLKSKVVNEYIKVGASYELKMINRRSAEEENYSSDWIWESSNADVATVDSNGKVEGKSIGVTTITGYGSNNAKTKAIIHVYRNNAGAVTVPQVEQGEGFSVILKEDGTVWTSGQNNYGQLGQGGTVNNNISVQVKIDEETFLTNVKKIYVSHNSVVALTVDGKVYAWGYNNCGMFGQGNTSNLYYATRVKGINGDGYLKNIIDVSIGYGSIFAVDKDGNLIGTGRGSHGELFGLSDTNLPVKLSKLEDVIMVNVGTTSPVAMLTNGETYSWGENYYGEVGKSGSDLTQPYYLGNDIVDIRAGGYSNYYLKEDGTVWSSGYNNCGQLGHGDTTSRSTFTQVKYSDGSEVKAKQIVAGSRNLVFKSEDGKVYITGYNGYGQMSNGTKDNALYPTLMKNSDDTAVEDALFMEAGESWYSNYSRNSAIIRADGTVWVSGDNTYGQIGNASNTSSTYLTKMGDAFLDYPDKWIEIGVGKTETIDEGKFSFAEDMNVFIDGIGILDDFNYTIENDEIISLNNKVITGMKQGITKINVKEMTTGIGTTIWVKVIDSKNVKIDAGTKFSIAVKEEGTVWTWGDNNYGQLGHGNNLNYQEPEKISSIPEKIVDARAGYYHAVALTENGEVYTWGYNGDGQLGLGNRSNSKEPIKVDTAEIGKIVKIDAYKNMTILLNEEGNVFASGGEYGDTFTLRHFSRKIIDIAGNIVLAENRRAYNYKEMSYGKDLIKITAGENHYLGLTSDGEVIAWGENGYGQLGNGNNTSSNIPSKVVTPDGTGCINNIVEISAGNYYSIISDIDGNVYTFGNASSGKLGEGITRNKAVKIEGLAKNEMVSASEGNHTLISDWNGFVYSTGANDKGQLGLKDTVVRNKFEMIGDIGIRCNIDPIRIRVNGNTDVNLYLGCSFNLKKDNVGSNNVTASIVNNNIATLTGSTVNGLMVGRTTLIATYEGAIGDVDPKEEKFTKGIPVYVLPGEGVAVPKVELGNGFSAALRANGTVWTWGLNNSGQLGIKTLESKNAPTKVIGLPDANENPIVDISVGNGHVLALTENGRVYSWGYGKNGQLGNGSSSYSKEPVVVLDSDGKELGDIIKVEAGANVSFAINSAGKVYAWGNGYGSLAQKVVNVDNAIDVTSQYVLDGLGKVWKLDTGSEVSIHGKVVELDEGANHTVMLTDMQTAYAIGDNTFGQLGNMSNTPSGDTPVALKIDELGLFDNIKQIRAGDRCTILVDGDGVVWTVGINDNNELAIDNTDIKDRNTLQQTTNMTDIMMVDAGYGFMSVVRKDGSVYTWGLGTSGQLGNRRNLSSDTPVMVGNYMVKTTTNHVTLGIGEEKYVEGYVDYFNILTDSEIGLNYNIKDSTVAILSESLPKDESAGRLGIRIKGNKVGTTIVTANQLGSNDIGVIQVEVIDSLNGIEPNVITNGSHTISLRVDGKVYTWGDNTFGQLGDSSTKSSDEPTEVKFPEGTVITQISAGENHSVALDSEGNVWTWGRNNYYQLGTTSGDCHAPQKLGNLPKIIKIATGNNNTMVLTENNELYAWGFNSYGDLGIGSYINKATVTKVEGIEDIIDISGGRSHFIALNRAGEIFTTGSNLYGQLGIDNSEISRLNEFTKVDISEKIGSIDAGELSNIAVTVDGYVYAWGGNTYGQLGTGSKESLYKPVRVSDLSNIREAEIGKSHSIVRDGNGRVLVSGANNYGQLGIATTDASLKFTENKLMDDVLRISSGNTYTVFLRKDGFVWACGDYNHGSSTKKSRTNSKVPVIVGSDTSSLDRLEIVIPKTEMASILANAKFKFNLIYIEENDTSDFLFTSYNEDIAKIDSDGDILAIREGTTWVKAIDRNTGKEHVAIVRVIDNTSDYSAHVAPKVSGGDSFVIALKEDGKVWTWGFDGSELAVSNIPSNANVVSTYKDIDSGRNFGLALREDGTVWSAGDNSYGQLGIGNTEPKAKFVQIEGLTEGVQISAGDTHALALDSYGIVYGWGSNQKGELGSAYIGKDTSTPQIITISSDRVLQISAGKNQSVFVTANGTVYGMGAILNGYIPNISDAVKVEVGDNYILILRADGSVYKYQYGVLVRVNGAEDVVDISVQGKVNMYQNVQEKVYTWGANVNGALGTNNTNSTSTPVHATENSTNAFRIGAGYNNTYIVDNTGYVYASGTNLHGELGNGTSENENSSTRERSLVHTLVGNRNFEVVPESNTLELNEFENITVKSDIFNVFGERERDSKEYTWESDNPTIITVIEEGKIQGIDLGTTSLKVTDKVTNEEKKVTRVVVAVDTDRIESISANGTEAEPVDTYKYEVGVALDETETTARVVIKTKESTDQISVDGGTTWETAELVTIVDIQGDIEVLPFIVKTQAGNQLNHTLTVRRLSNNNRLEEDEENGATGITVKKAGKIVEENAVKVDDSTYEIVVPKTGVHVVKVTAEHEKATVSINGYASTLKQQSYNLVMTENIVRVPIKVTSESGREEKYTLIVYSEDYVKTLSGVFVNGEKATTKDNTNYEIYIDDLVDLSNVKAITSASTSKVSINGGTAMIKEVTENVDTSEDLTVVTILVENDNIASREYTLKIYKQRTLGKIQNVKVNGTEIKEYNKIYTAYVKKDDETAGVEISAKDTDYYITLDDFDEENYIITKVVDVIEDSNMYDIKVRDDVSGDVEEYTLIIKRGESDGNGSGDTVDEAVRLERVYAQNNSISVDAVKTGEKEYTISLPNIYASTNLTVKTINSQAKVEIGQSDIDNGLYKYGSNTKNIELQERETIIPVKVVSVGENEEDLKEEQFTIKLIRLSDDVSLDISVDEYPSDNSNQLIQAGVVPEEDDTYLVQLEHAVSVVEVIANATDESAEVKIEENEYTLQIAEEEVVLSSNVTTVYITVKSEFGTEKTYRLKIVTLEDNTAINSIEVNGYTAEYNRKNSRYEIRIKNPSDGYYGITVETVDINATIELDGDTSVGTAQATFTKTSDEMVIPIAVTSQNGLTTKIYQLVITKKSDIAHMEVVRVNGVDIAPDLYGNYVADVASTIDDISIYAESSDEYSILELDGITVNENKVTVNRSLSRDGNEYTIVVVSEDGTNVVEKTLIINKLSGNTNIAEITVTSGEIDYTATEKTNGIYYVKVKRSDSAVVGVTLEDSNAVASIASGTSRERVALLNEITNVSIVVTAEDGNSRIVILQIEKESNDAGLASVSATLLPEDSNMSEPIIEFINSTTYEMMVDSRLSSINLSATTINEFAKIKLGTEDVTQYLVNKIENKLVDLTQDSFTIDVLAEDGETTRTYVVKIVRVFTTEVEKVLVDGEELEQYENVLSTFIDANDTEAQIIVTPKNNLAEVEIYKDGNLITSGKGEIEFTDTSVTDNTAKYRIKIINPADANEYSTYILNLTKKSKNNNLEYVNVNSQEVFETPDTDVYEVQVLTVANDQYELKVKAEDEYAIVKFDDGEYSENNVQIQNYTLQPKEERNVVVTVKSQNGEENIKNVKIYRKDNDTSIETLKINGESILDNYNSNSKNYRVVLENTETEATLEIIVESDEATINTEVDSVEYNDKKQIYVENISLPGVGKKVITFTIIAEDGTRDTRTITISQFSSNVELDKVTVNEENATLREDGNYEITIGNIPPTAVIYAKAKDESSKVAINGQAATLGASTLNMYVKDLETPVVVNIPIKVTAENDDEYEYMLFVTVKSADNEIEYVKVGEDKVDATKIADTTYRVFVKNSLLQVPVEIKAKNDSAMVKVEINQIEQIGNPLVFTQLLNEEKNYVKFYMIADSGDIAEYTLEIFKESPDNEVGHIYVNEVEVTKNEETGRYTTKVNEEDGNPIIKVVASNEFAYVRINVFDEEQSETEREVELKNNSKITTVQIAIRSQTGETRYEYLDIERIFTRTQVDTLVVDEVEVTNYNSETKTFIAIVDQNIEEHEVFIMAGNSYANIEIEEEIGVGNITVFETMETDAYERDIPFSIVSETGGHADYTLKLVKKSDNVKVSKVVVNDVEARPELDRPDVYKRGIRKLADKAKIRVETDYPYATLMIADHDIATGVSEVWVDLDLREDEITVPVVVKATDGETIATYNIILIRNSNDTSMVVKYSGDVLVRSASDEYTETAYDEQVLSADESDGNYYLYVLDTVTGGILIIETTDEGAQIDIGNSGTYTQNEETYNVVINPEEVDRVVEVPIKIVAADETEANSKLIITRISTNVDTEKVERIVDNEDETESVVQATVDEEYFVIGVNENTEKVSILITAKDSCSMITRGVESSVGTLRLDDISLTGKITYVNYKVTSESGTVTDIRTIKIIRQSNNNKIGKIEVENEEIMPDENGIYVAEVMGGTEEAKVKITAESDVAKIAVTPEPDTGEGVAVLDTNVDLPNNENVFIVTVTAEDGTKKTYTLKIVKQTNIVGKILTNNSQGKHKSIVTVYKTSDTRDENDVAEDEKREIVDQVETKDDGTFVVKVTDITKYDLVVTKPGYLDYRITDIEVEKSEKTVIDEYELIAGNVVKYTLTDVTSGSEDDEKNEIIEEIELDDLVALNNNLGTQIIESNKDEMGKYDFNEDGVVNVLDRNILKSNYGKKAEIVKWVKS